MPNELHDPQTVPMEVFNRMFDSQLDTLKRHSIALEVMSDHGLMLDYARRCENEITSR